jgi:putative ABC transport system permease protein
VLLPRSVREEGADALGELFELRAARDGERAAAWWYRQQVVPFVVRVWLAEARDARAGAPRAAARTGREPMRALMSELRYAGRTLLRSPGFAAVAVLTLALGIGANTAIFSVIRSVLLRPLPFPEAERVYGVSESRLDRGWESTSFTHPNFWDVRDMNRTFEAIGALEWTTINLAGGEYPERLYAARVTEGFFRALGVRAEVGRLFAEGEDQAGSDTRIVVLSNLLWTTRYGRDRSLVGRSITLDGASHTVIGVLPPGSPWLDAADVFIPLVRAPDANRGSFEVMVVGRLKDGVTVERAQADLDGIATRLAQLYPEPNNGMGIALNPSADWIAGDALRRALWILMGGVGLLLLIACVNIANLLLARSTARAREHAVRTALGASRRRLVRLVLAESAIVGLAGAGLGLVVAGAAVRLLQAMRPANVPRLSDVSIDGWVLAFTMGVALVTAIATGLIPALRAPYADVMSTLRDGERSVVGSRRHGRMRGALVAVEVALSIVLLVGAGLLVRSFREVLGVERGFQAENRLFVEVATPSTYDSAERVNQLMTTFLSRVEALPQVRSAAAINVRPLQGTGVGLGFGAADRPQSSGDDVPWASWRLITPGYFETIGARIIAGRDFSSQDRVGDAWRVIVSKRIADELWPGENAIGRTILLWKGQSDRPAEVVGVVADMRDWGLEAGPTFAVYIPYLGAGFSPVQFVLHTNSAVTGLVPRLRSILAEIDPALPLSNVQRMEELVGEDVATRRFTMVLLAAFACLALLLALAGVYGVLSYSVARRRSEIGMRVALGASRASVLRMIVLQGMRPVAWGITAGIAGALALSRLMSSLLFEVQPADAPTYAAVAGVLTLAAVLACYLPARGAMRMNVVTALREE